MMKKLMALMGGVGCLALQACGAGDLQGDAEVIAEESANTSSPTAVQVVATSQWSNGYCVNVTVRNELAVSANSWFVMLDMKGTSIQVNGTAKNVWNASANSATNVIINGNNNGVTFTPQSYNSYIAPQGTTTFGFCANRAAGSTTVAAPLEHNMTSTQYAACSTNSGTNPTRAALAVAMANEMGRWQPETDLVKGGSGKVEVSATGMSRCTNGCVNTKAILAQQDSSVSSMVPQSLFNPTVYMEDLKASFDRQKNKIDNLRMNSPGQLPPAHKLTLVGGPVNLGGGSCGPHYVYSVTDTNGVNLTSAQASNLQNSLCFYGQGSCGQNPYIGFATTNLPGCPAGKTCIAIDPNDGDNNSGSTTTAGSAPSYPMNRTYNPSYSLLNTSCITKAGQLGKMKCLSSGCNGYLYCTP